MATPKRSHITKPFATEPRGAIGKYTPELVKEITNLISIGVKARHAAAKVGISDNAFYQWMAEKPQFNDAVKEARAKFCAAHVVRIEKAANTHWTASAWMLERVLPEDYGRTHLEVSGPNGGPIAITAIQQGGDIASAIRNNPATFAEHEALLSGHIDSESITSGVRDDNDADGKRKMARRKVSPADKPRARGRVQGKNTKTRH